MPALWVARIAKNVYHLCVCNVCLNWFKNATVVPKFVSGVSSEGAREDNQEEAERACGAGAGKGNMNLFPMMGCIMSDAQTFAY